jgi:hypothetical protein
VLRLFGLVQTPAFSPLGERVGRRPDALHREAGRAFARRRVMDAQGAKPGTARRRVRGSRVNSGMVASEVRPELRHVCVRGLND